MSDQETRDRGRRRREARERKKYGRSGPPKAKRRLEPWCDEYEGEEPMDDTDFDELDFND